jgi:hypothetical protein
MLSTEFKLRLRGSQILIPTNESSNLDKIINARYRSRKIMFNQIRQSCILSDTYEYSSEFNFTVEQFNNAIFGGPNTYTNSDRHIRTLLYLTE